MRNVTNTIFTMSEQIYLDAPNIGGKEKEFLDRALDSGYVSTVGPFVPEFEDRFAGYLGITRAVATQSGTAALHMALRELNIGPGDEVIVPALTFVATVNPVIYMGARPVFVDVDALTWNIDPREIAKAITGKTKAVIPVHLFGNPCNMEEIMAVAGEHGIFVIEDATESLGAKWRGGFTGTFGEFGCFSFNGNKIITTGGGGMIAGRNKKSLEHIKFLVNQARDEEKGYYHPEVGFNYRMTNIEAALGLAQMERLDGFLAKKKLFNRIYREELGNLEFTGFQCEYDGAESSWWLSCITLDNGTDMQALQAALGEKGIPARRLFMPVTEFPPYKSCRSSGLGNTYRLYEQGICLPSSTLNDEDAIYRVCKTIRGLVA